jgi:biopolymer transport protein ExbD
VELLAQGARFYEVLGYTLAVLAVGILGAGVIWSLRLHVSQQRRALFLVGSLAALAMLCSAALLVLIVSQPLSFRTIPVQRPRQLDPGPGREDTSNGVYMVDVQVQADGALICQGAKLDAESLIPYLRREYGTKQLSVTIHADADVSIGAVQPIIQQLQQHGVQRYALRVNKQAESHQGR